MADTRDLALPAHSVVYDYSDAPTLRQFALSNSRIRLVIGPFGSGKSSACVMEIIRRGHEQKPSADGIRRTRWAVVRNCFDDKTEVLTEKRGWQLFKDLSPDDKVASLVKGRELVFVKPLNYYVYQYDDVMIGYSNRNLDFLVTPEHNLYASMINGRTKEMYGYKFYKAEDIYGMTHYKFKTNADEYKGGYSEFSEKMFEFFGFWFAEGYVGKYPRKDTPGYHWRFTVTQKDNAEYVAKLLSDCGFKYGKNKGGGSAFNYSIYINDDIKLLIEKLLPCGKSTTKYLPDWIKSAPKGHLKAFLRGYEEGDGHTRANKNDSTRLYTSSEKLANDLQEIIFKSGGSASLSKRVVKQRAGSFIGQGFMFVLTIHQPNQYQPQTQKKNGWYQERYKGKVYCIEVPSHVIAIRRNGIISMNSQSYNQLKDTTIKTFHDWFPHKIFGEYRITDHSYMITRFPGVQIEILFRALDRPDQVSNLLSLELTGAWFNEAREIPKSIIEAMDGRIDRYPAVKDGGCTWTGIIMDTNPPDDDSYLYKMFEVVRPIGWEVFKQPSGLSAQAENTRYLAKNYYQNLARGKDERYIRVYIHGEYGFQLAGKPVFTGYRDNIHCARMVLEPMKNMPLIIGLDFGLTPCCTIGQITPFGQLRIIDELVSDGMAIKQFCLNQLLPLLRRKYFGYTIVGYGDPAGTQRVQTDESTCFDVLHSAEIGLQNVISAPTNSIVARVGAVDNFLSKMINGEPGFVLSPNCRYLRKAFNGDYHYALEKSYRGGVQEAKDMPVKNFSCVDMETEILTLDGWKYRDEINIGDQVFGYKDGVIIRDVIKDIFDYDGGVECIKFSSPTYEFVFTEEHRCLVVHNRKKEIKMLAAGEVNGNYSFLTSAGYKDDTHKFLISDWFIRLCAWILTEGHYREDGSVVIVQSITHNPEYVKSIDRLLKNSPYLINRCIYNNIVRWKINKELAILVRYMMPDKCPSYEFVMKMRNSQRRLFLYECLRGDGFYGGPMPEKNNIKRNRDFWLNRKYNNDVMGKITPRFTAKRKHHIDVLQMLATMVGIETHIRVKRQKNSGAYDLSFIDKNRINIGRMEKQKVIVSGVWCPKTLTGTWIMRRGGVVLITGNSHIADSCEYLCLYIDEKQEYEKQKREVLSRMARRDHHPATRIGGY